MPKKMLTIAGSDILAGGGIQADLATFNEYGYFGLSVITSIVTVTGDDFEIHPISLDVLEQQLLSVKEIDDVVGIKVGLLPTLGHIEMVGGFLKQFVGKVPIVIDPVMAFKETDNVDVSAVATAYREKLLPIASIITPNLLEAQWLLGHKISTELELLAASSELKTLGPENVVVKGGGRLPGAEALDALVTENGSKQLLRTTKVENGFINGAGCTFASGIASNLAKGLSVTDSVSDAKNFVRYGIEFGVPLNQEMPVGNVWQAARRNEA
jgi:pyridoxine kinase